MKGLSLTLEVIVIAIALLVTVLVIITVFGGQIANFLGIFNPWSEDVVAQNLCSHKCASWCQLNSDKTSTSWGNIDITVSGKPKNCGDVMSTYGSTECKCGLTTVGGGTTGGASGASCTVATSPCSYLNQQQTKDVSTSMCKSGKCIIDCNTIPDTTGTCQ